MKFLIAIVVVACFAQSALSSWAGHGAYHGGWAGAGAYHGPLAAPVVTPSGFLADTPEVAAAKAAHFAEVAKAGAGAGVPYAAGYAGAGAYHGPLAAPVVTPSGFLADTPEVAAAKAAHLSLLTHAGAAAGAPYAGAWAGPYAGAGVGHWAGAGHYADPNESGQYVPSHNEGQYIPDQNHW